MNKKIISITIGSLLLTASAYGSTPQQDKNSSAVSDDHNEHHQSLSQRQEKASSKTTATLKKAQPISHKNASYKPSPISVAAQPTVHPQKKNTTFIPSEVVKVNPATGVVHIAIPLLHIPQSDGVAIDVTLHNESQAVNAMEYSIYGNPVGSIASQMENMYTNGSMSIYSGMSPVVNFSGGIIYSCEEPTFIAPDGSRHVFYPVDNTCFNNPWRGTTSARDFVSKDHWHASLASIDAPDQFPGKVMTFHGEVIAPDGTVYVVAPRLMQIRSPHRGTVINYAYEPVSGMLTKISNQKDVSISFTNMNSDIGYKHNDLKYYNLDAITYNGSVWHFNHDHGPNGKTVAPHLTQLTLPDGSSWQLSYSSLDFGPNDITTPLGMHYHLDYVVNPDGSVRGPFDESLGVNHSAERLTISGLGMPKRVLSYGYLAPQFTNGHFDATYRTSCNDGNTEKEYTWITGLVPSQPGNSSPKSMIPNWNSGLLDTEQIKTEAGNVLETIHDTWSSQPITSADGAANEPELMHQTISRGNTLWESSFIYDKDGFETSHTETSPFGSRELGSSWYKNPAYSIFTPQNESISPIDKGTKGKPVRTIERTFNTQGEMTSESDNGVTTTYGYDGTGNLTSETNALGQKTSYADYEAGYPQTITDPKGNATKNVINPAGMLMQSTDPLGHTTKYTYDAMFRPLSMIPPSGLPTTWTYTAYPATPEASTTAQTGTKKIVTMENSLGSVDYRDLSSGGTFINRIVYRYDMYGRSIFQSSPSTDQSASILGTYTTRDILGRIHTVTTAIPLSAIGNGLSQ